MSPECRTKTALGPLSGLGRRTVGGAMVSLALVLGGMASPAMAAAQGVEKNTDPSVTTAPDGHRGEDGDECKDKPGKPKDRKCKERPPVPPGQCFDIDAIRRQASREQKAALVDGTAYVGIRDLRSQITPFVWQDLTDPAIHPGYPPRACAISIAEHNNLVSVEVLTLDGEVYETRCEVDPSGGNQDPGVNFALDCVGTPTDDIGPWFQLTSPEDSMLKAGKRS